jgi:hypothetical protein
MPSNNKNNLPNLLKYLLAFTSLISLGLWLYLRFANVSTDSNIGNYFALSLSVTPFLAGIFGFDIAKAWGGTKSLLGKAIVALSTGLTLWALGNFTWAYYNLVKQVEAPYPSLADVGYGLGVLFWILSTVYLGRALGVGLLLKKSPGLKWLSAGFTIGSIALSYYLFVVVARGGSLGLQSDELLKAFFDLYYPLTDVCALVVISMVFIVSARYIGGLLKVPVLAILFGMLSSYIYDLTFSYSTTKETYTNGQFSDIFLLIATVCLSASVVMFGMRAAKLRVKA